MTDFESVYISVYNFFSFGKFFEIKIFYEFNQLVAEYEINVE